MHFVNAKGKDLQKGMIDVKSWEAGLFNRLVLSTGSDMVGCRCGNLKLMLRAVIGYHSVWDKGTLLYRLEYGS